MCLAMWYSTGKVMRTLCVFEAKRVGDPRFFGTELRGKVRGCFRLRQDERTIRAMGRKARRRGQGQGEGDGDDGGTGYADIGVEVLLHGRKSQIRAWRPVWPGGPVTAVTYPSRNSGHGLCQCFAILYCTHTCVDTCLPLSVVGLLQPWNWLVSHYKTYSYL